MPTCPNGHQSGSDDWCEVCGHRMTGAGAPAGAVPPPPPPPPAPGYGYQPGPGPDATQQAELCPQCRTPREAMAPFCEECRWNFLTNTATSYTPLAPHGVPGPPPGLNLPPGFQAQQPPGPQQQRDPFEYQSSRPSQVNRPAEPLSPDQGSRPGPPPPPAPGPQSPQPFQQQGPPPSFQQQQQSAPPAFGRPGPTAPPAPQQSQPPQPLRSGDDADWMLSPPSAQAPQPPAPQQQQPQFPGQNQPPASWTAVIAPDREYFLAMMQRSGPEATGLNLPAYSPEQQLPLTGNQITIGRRRQSTGESPDIDLSVPPEDPGVSHQHAVLVQQPDGSWAVVDQNSTNGTTLNGAEDPIQPYVPVPLQDGDQVHVGAWTTITIRRD
ncbi:MULTISPECIES: FHA domain-containing protein [unclassified Streptomyces]|uniref:FHA domain-containing protein n=1 Tax=unclassified Streptomyces TaxID=2593676 RepID=UPI002255C336|nr:MULTISPECIES: FHA domain-containing protein [unclassified Streptomyces]MCX4797460.1 FHA domain-containing protein [Streptomyces sp. NBC_01242]WSJ38767.1 FHA domain-containing protein [Streptomyces sp. NBC_01321]WSP65063.1 FHA domain-containing protein [Streptomyces sp. NBC_01240]